MSESKDATQSHPHSHIFRDLLAKTSVSSLLRDNMHVVTVDADQNVVAAFQVLVQNKILSAPVFDSTTNHYIGFLDVRDLVQFVVATAEEDEKKRLLKAEERKAKAHHAHSLSHSSHHSHSHSHHPSDASSTATSDDAEHDHLLLPPPDFRSIFDVAATFHEASDTTEMNTRYFAKHHPFCPVKRTDTLLTVAELLARGDVHRVPVVSDDHSQVIDIVSQSTFVKALYEHRNELKDILHKTIEEVKIGSRPVICMKTTNTAMETFRLMAKTRLTGMAIVDDSGRFTGNTSASDLKLFIQNPEKNIRTLRYPIIDFLNAIRRYDNPITTKSPTISVRPDDTIEKVVGKLYVTHIHRIFVCDEKHGYKPEAVISLTDLLRYVLDINDSDVSTENGPKITISPV